MAVTDPRLRFSSRVENYARYRPGYPPEVVELLKSECGLTSDSAAADIASGTGIFTRLLLQNGNRVFGVEPNPEMRRAGEELLAGFPQFSSVAGAAEATTLPDHCVDMITAAQAAHWFDREKARREFCRILKPGGWVVLLWNERSVDATPFLKAYERLLQTYSTDYHEVRHEHTTSSIDAFFAPSPFQERVFETKQELDYSSLEGRLLSSSYMPQAEQPNYGAMLRELQRIFDDHQSGGLVVLQYRTRLYYGKLS
jgi:SAM-dependent methyltransferase